ncbi:hypothetical protein [uncultured Christiangramia sp.]|uniref:hypothetical protein n=1 Tax=Christiangramia sp. 3-2217-3z TaxID=3417564 RepID=UPI0026063355|nr:hypothetical protein [uncultured Christiangramia sp.]
MNIGLNQYYDTISFKYINDIIYSIQKNLIDASQKDNDEVFKELLDFYQYTLLAKSFNKNLKAYSKTSTLSIYIFKSLKDSHRVILAERIFESLVMKINVGENYEDIDQNYIEVSYLPLINITKLLIQEKKYDLLDDLYNKVDQSLFRLDYEKDKSGYFFKFININLCWVYYLKFHSDLDSERSYLKYFEKNFENLTVRYNSNFLNDFFDLFDKVENNGLWAVNQWEIKEPPMNVAYFALTPNIWLRFGLVIILLKFPHLIRNNEDFTRIKLNNRFRFIVDDISRIMDNIGIDNESYMDFIFPDTSVKNLDLQLKSRKEKILNLFQFLQKEIEIDRYNKIRKVPLSDTRIDKFRQNVGKQWEENLIIIRVLEHFQKINFLPNNEKIDGYGFFQTLNKMRFAFIDGEYYQDIIGLNDFGSRLARSIDNLFFGKLEKIKTPKLSNQIQDDINSFIDKTKNKKNLVIFANWQTEKKIGKLDYQDNTFPISHKRYNNIPIINSFNKYSHLIFIIDFTNVKANIFVSENSNWYKNQLLVEVSEYQKELITDDLIREWNEKEGQNYTEQEVDVLESNHVNAKILFKSEFIFDENFRFLIINPE